MFVKLLEIWGRCLAWWLTDSPSVSECLGSITGLVPASSFLLMQNLGDTDDGLSNQLPAPRRKTWTEFLLQVQPIPVLVSAGIWGMNQQEGEHSLSLSLK